MKIIEAKNRYFPELGRLVDVFVDDENYNQLLGYKWRLNPKGYVLRSQRIHGRNHTIMMHRQIMKAPIHLHVDHKNHNKRDNTKNNLRLVSNHQNCANQIKSDKRGISKFKGVSFNRKTNKWRAELRAYLGEFDTEKEAAQKYDFYAKIVYGEYAYTNVY